MMDRIEGLPFPLAVAILFVVVLLRGNATYWVGRVAHTGVGRTRARELLSSAGFRSAQTLISRWGAPVITVSFLTIGFQTVANLAAGATRMPLRRYLPAMIIGCGHWAIIYASVGFVTFAALRRLYEQSPAAALVVASLLVLALAGFVAAQGRGRKPQERT